MPNSTIITTSAVDAAGSLNTMAGFNGTSGTVTISAGANANTVYTTNNTAGIVFSQPSHGNITASDVILDGVSLSQTLKSIQDRLAILVPDLAKHEKFAALKASYEHYKLLEKLCTE